MKIIYLFEWRLDKPSGVTNKVLSQTKVWRELGHEVDLLCVTTTPVSPIFKQQNMKLYIFTTYMDRGKLELVKWQL